MEFYKFVGEYFVILTHERTGEVYYLKAKVAEGPLDSILHIWFSHTHKAEAAMGFYYSNSFTKADSLDDAENKIRQWADMMARSYEVTTWSADMF